MDRIESVKNPRVKAARALQTVKGRDRSGMFLCEGEHMVSEAVRAIGEPFAMSSAFALGSAFALDTLFVEEGQQERFAALLDAARADHVFEVPAHVLQAISTVKSPQGIAAVVRLQTPPVTRRNYLGMLFEQADPLPGDDMEEDQPPADAGPASEPAEPEAEGVSPFAFLDGIFGEDTIDDGDSPAAWSAQAAPPGDEAVSPAVLGDKLVLLENVQDPGNVGTILRTMDAAGFTGALLAPGCADPFSPKALRATMGSIFRVPTLQVENAAQTAALLRDEGYAVVAAALSGTDFFSRAPLPGKVCLMIGNEGAGLTEAALAAATHTFRLPMKGGAESLNAAAAAAILIYEIAFRG